ncbi:testis-expressed protein 36 [Tachysurus fulvidraco]|uniref:testis-expressed protein 36 n=1 Tax=Tachysurus fulvidraco TaxID=1234273 RepID=UPI000F4FA37B|nr:testis-expressed protein 36 [Tachysurus fulvidraco]
MTKGGKRYANMDQDGKWFAHVGWQQCDVTREACTTTGAMLSEATPQQMQGQEKYPKTFNNQEKKTRGRSYPFSEHDNRAALQDNIATYGPAFGRKKCLDDRRQHDSHFCLCHDTGVSEAWLESKNLSSYQTDFLARQQKEITESTEHKRRFPRNPLEKSHQAAVAQAEESYMWFGRDDIKQRIPLNVLAAANLSSAL